MVKHARRKLNNVHPDFTFKLVNGGELKNLEELLKYLREMNIHTYSHHVTNSKNDFAKWVRDVVKDEELANEMENYHGQIDMERVVRNRIIQLHDQIQREEDFASFKDLLPMEAENTGNINETKKEESKDVNETQVSKEKSEEDVQDIPKLFDFKSLDDVKTRIHTIATGALFGIIIGLILGYILGSF